MAKQYTTLQTLLFRLQTDRNVAEVDLDEDDFLEAAEVKIGIDAPYTEIKASGKSGFLASVPGGFTATLDFKIRLASGGASTFFGPLNTALQASRFLATPTVGVCVYTITDIMAEIQRATAWGYSGNKDASSSLLYKMSNILLKPKLVLDLANGYGWWEFSGIGALDSVTASSSCPAVTGIGTTAAVALKGGTISYFYGAYETQKFEYDPSVETMVTEDMGAVSGIGGAEAPDVNGKFSHSTYAEGSIAIENDWSAGTVGPISLSFGSTPNKHTFAIANAQISKVTNEDQKGLQGLMITGVDILNGFTYTMDTGA